MRKPLPRPIRQFVAVPNEFYNGWLKEIEGNECLILNFIFRKTLGWGKQEDWISLSQFVKGTNLSKNTIRKYLLLLIDKEMIYFRSEGEQGEEKHYYKLNVEEDPSSKFEPAQDLNMTSSKFAPTINNLTKDIKKDDKELSTTVDKSVSNSKVQENKGKINSLLKMVNNKKILADDSDNCRIKYMREIKSICSIMQERGWCNCTVCGWILKQVAESLIKTYGEEKLKVLSVYYALMNKVPLKFIEDKAEIINAMIQKTRDEI